MSTTIIETERLRLRGWKATDHPIFVTMNQDPDVRRFFPNILTEEESMYAIKRYQEHLDEHGYTFFAVERKEDQAFIGMIGLWQTSFEAYFTPCVEIGWRLGNAYWGKGYATEGAKTCLDFAFNQLGIKEVLSFTPRQNTPSQRVMQRIGMTKIGEFGHPKLPKDHKLVTHVLYSIKARDKR